MSHLHANFLLGKCKIRSKDLHRKYESGNLCRAGRDSDVGVCKHVNMDKTKQKRTLLILFIYCCGLKYSFITIN